MIAILAIAIVTPLSSIAIWNTAQSFEFVETSLENQKIVALSSFYPLYEFTKEVGQNNVEVSLLVPSGVEPHDWEPSIQDLQRIQQADIIIINGVGFENWIDDIEKFNSDVIVLDSSKGINIIKKINVKTHENYHDLLLRDPHIWLSPPLAKIQVQNIANGLIELDSDNEQYYRDNSKNFIKKLDALDLKIKNELSDCNKDFISFHSAFTYFAKEYGLNQHSILLSTEPHEEPTSKTLQRVVNLAKELNIQIIFTEEAVDKRTSEVIAQEIEGKVLTLSPIEVGETNTSYIEKMESNLSNLKEALCY